MINNKFFRRLFSCFIVLFFVVFTLGMGISLYQDFQMARSELERSRETVLLQWADKMDSNIGYLSQVNQSFAATDEFRSYLTADSMEPFDTYRAYQSYRRIRMRNEGYSAGEKGKIAIVRLGGRLALTPEGTCDITDYLKSVEFPGSIMELYSYFSGVNGQFPQFGQVIRSTPDSSYITVVQRGRLETRAEYLMFLSLDKAEIFKNVSSLDASGMALLMDGEILAAAENLDTAGLEAFLTENPLPDTLDQASYSDRNGTFAFKACAYLPLFYVYAGPKESLGGISVSFLGIFAAFLIFGVIGCYLLSRQLYRPMVRLLKKFEGTGPDGKDEFAFLEDVSSQMREDNLALAATLDKTRDLVRNEALRGLLYGTHSAGELLERLSFDEFAWLNEPTMVAIFRQDRQEGGRQFDSGPNQLWEILSSMLKQSFAEPPFRIRCELLPIETGTYGMVAGSGNAEWVKERLVQVLSAIQSEHGQFLTAALGGPARYPDELRKAFSSARYVAEYQNLLGQGRYVLAPGDLSFRDENYYYPLRLEHDLISFTAQGMERETYAVLEEILEENFQKRTLAPDKISLFCFAVTATISRILEIMDRTADIFGEKSVVYLELKLYDDTESLCRKITGMFATLLQEAFSSTRKQEYTMANQLIAYVRENYARDISLTDLSEKFNMSQGYISTLFKNLAGTNFKEYLSRLRFEKAVEILEKKPYTQTKDLAGMIGLNTPKAVIALFNKYAGMSPKQYVSSHLNL